MAANRQKLFQYITDKNIEGTKLLIDNQDERGETAIMSASMGGRTDTVRILIKERADLDLQDNFGRTALIFASIENQNEIVELLIKGRAGLDIQNKNGETAIMWASIRGLTDTVRILIKGRAGLDLQDKFGRTALMFASTQGNNEIVKLLIKGEASLDIQNQEGETAIMSASMGGRTDTVRILIEGRAGLNLEDKFGRTALMFASTHGNNEIVELLITGGADLDIQNHEGLTALMLSMGGDNEIVELLMKGEADLDIQNQEGLTALMLAVTEGDNEMVELLMKGEASLDIQNKKDYTALMLAVTEGDNEIVELLIKGEAGLDLQNKSGETALIIASKEGYHEIVKLLIAGGANLDIKDMFDRTAFDYAKNKQIRNLLSPGPTEKWKGFTQSDISTYDNIFDDTNAIKYSLCPICLNYIEKSEGCMYMSHKCTASGNYYHKELYDKYKNTDGTIFWCTICSRISLGHRHFNLVNANGKKAELVDSAAATPYATDCTGHGGGGMFEKLARLRRLREYGLELQDDVGIKGKEEALDELVEEVWNAPLVRNKKILQQIAETKKWNVNVKNFPENTVPEPVPEPNNTNAPNIPFNGKLPTEVESGRNNVIMNDNIPILRVHHKQKDGSEKSHGIGKEYLKEFITDKNKNFGDESFGFCFIYPGPCDSRLHPEELKGHVPDELYEDYKKKFNKKFRGQHGGNRENIIQEAKDAVCVIVKKHRGGSRKRRATRRTRKRRL